MTIFIDGYNLLKTVLQTDITQKDCMSFIRHMQKYASIKSHIIFIVFDGGSLSGLYKESYGQVTVLYSGKYSADDVIVEQIQLMPKDQTLVVSNDHALCKMVANMHYISIGVIDFYGYVRRALSLRQEKKVLDKKSIKTTDSINEELDKLLMDEDKIIIKKHDNIIPFEYNDQANKVSKQDRKFLMILKKL